MAETEDGAPTLTQPTARPTRSDIWVPVSIELAATWSGMRGELGRLIADARDVEEASAFAVGAGTAQYPEGLVTGATIIVDAGTVTLGVQDLYDVEEALPSRWQGRAQWVGARHEERRPTAVARPTRPSRNSSAGRPASSGAPTTS